MSSRVYVRFNNRKAIEITKNKSNEAKLTYRVEPTEREV